MRTNIHVDADHVDLAVDIQCDVDDADRQIIVSGSTFIVQQSGRQRTR